MNQTFDPQKRFDERAAEYDSDIETILPAYKSLHETTYYLLKSYLNEKAKIVVAGAGTGNESILFASGNPGWLVKGFDLSREMINRANIKISEKGLEKRVKIICGNIKDIDEYDFDAAISLLVMHFIEDKKSYIENICKRLKTGGIFIVADITGEKDTNEFDQFLSVLKIFQSAKGRDKEKIDDTYRNIRENLFIISEKELIGILKKSGFSKIRNYYRNLLVQSFIAQKT